VYVGRILFEGRERITTSLGTFNTLRFKPEMLRGQVFNQPYPMTLWVSDDKNKIPIRAESGLIVGCAGLDLTHFCKIERRSLIQTVNSHITLNHDDVLTFTCMSG